MTQEQIPVPQPPEAPKPELSPSDQNDRLMAALAYIIAVIVPLVILLSESGKQRAYQRYHAIQSLAISAVSIVWFILLFILSLILTAVCAPLGCLVVILYLAPAVPMIWGAYESYNGRWWEIPILTQFLKDQKWL
jgi:uncharacterized membrane protein